MRWRRRRRVDVGRFEAPAPRPEPSFDDLVDDGMLIAEAAVRMAVKNELIVRALRDRTDFRPDTAAAVAVRELRRLAVESEMDARRLDEEREHAEGRVGAPTHQTDYRADDTGRLARRSEVLRTLADRLVRLSADRAHLDRLVEVARRQAWEEIGASILERTALAWGSGAAVSPAERRARVRELERDLRRLHAERAPEQGA